MKTIIIQSLVWCMCASSIWAQKAEEVFHVSKVGKDKKELHKAFSLIQKMEKTEKYGRPISFEVLQKLDDKGFLSYKTRTVSRVIGSGLSSVGGGGGSYVTSSEVTDRSKIYYLVTLKPKSIADGDKLESIWIIETTKMKSYTDTRGAKRTVRIMEEVVPVDLSQQDFVKRLKSGESWLLKGFSKKRCKNCFGDGELGAMKKYAKCPDCRGKGSRSVDYRIQW